MRRDDDNGPEINAAWRAAMGHIENALAAAGLSGDCVELDAGTGYWTEQIARRVERLTAIDAAPEMLEIARVRCADIPTVEFEIADLWQWIPARRWESAAAFFFLEHVPDEIFPTLLADLAGALVPGARLFVAEGAWEADEPPSRRATSKDANSAWSNADARPRSTPTRSIGPDST